MFMSAPDKKTVMKDLFELGKSKGQLTTKEILDALGELDFELEQIEKFYDSLEAQGVEIVEDFGEDITLEDIEFEESESAQEDAILHICSRVISPSGSKRPPPTPFTHPIRAAHST